MLNWILSTRYVHSCKLNESIPPEIGKLRNLQILYALCQIDFITM